MRRRIGIKRNINFSNTLHYLRLSNFIRITTNANEFWKHLVLVFSRETVIWYWVRFLYSHCPEIDVAEIRTDLQYKLIHTSMIRLIKVMII